MWVHVDIGSTARQTAENTATAKEIVSKLRPVHVIFDLNLRPGMYNAESVTILAASFH